MWSGALLYRGSGKKIDEISDPSRAKKAKRDAKI